MSKFNLGGIFKRKESSSRRETRGSSSSQPVRTSYNEDLEEIGVIELGRESDVHPSSYPCYELLHAACIHGEVISLITNAQLTKIVLEERPQYVKLANIFVQSFNFIDDLYHPSVEFMLYERPCSMRLSEFCRAIGVPDEGLTSKISEQPQYIPQGGLRSTLP